MAAEQNVVKVPEAAPMSEAGPSQPATAPPAAPPALTFFTNPETEPHVLLIVLLVITFAMGAVLMAFY